MKSERRRAAKTSARTLARRVAVPHRVRPLLQMIGRLAQRRGLRAYAVGGCVRDWLLGISRTPDVDITVEGNGIDLARDASQALKGTFTIHQ